MYGAWFTSPITKSTENWARPFSLSFSFILVVLLLHRMHRQIHTHATYFPLWVFCHREERNGSLWPDRLLRHHITQPAIPVVCRDSLVFFPSRDSKCEELTALLQYLVNVYMSVGKRDGERGRDESVGVGCCENRDIMLLGGHSVGRAGKKIIAPQLKICWTLNQRQTAWCIFSPSPGFL